MKAIRNNTDLVDNLYLDSQYYFFFELETVFGIFEFLEILSSKEEIIEVLEKAAQTISYHKVISYTSVFENREKKLYSFDLIVQAIRQKKKFSINRKKSLYYFYQDMLIKHWESVEKIKGVFIPTYGGKFFSQNKYLKKTNQFLPQMLAIAQQQAIKCKLDLEN